MKRTIVVLAVAAASMVTFAQPPANPAPASAPAPARATVSPPAVPLAKKEGAQVPVSKVSTPFTELGKPVVTHEVWRVGGMSSRPWAQVVGMKPGYSAFTPPETRDPSMYLFWIGRDPH